MIGLLPSIESTCEPLASVTPTNWPGRAATNSAVVAPLELKGCGGAAI